MFTKHWWNILNIQWHPVITTALTRSSLCQCITSCFTNATTPIRYPDRNHSPAVTKQLIEHGVTRPRFLSVSLRWKTGNLSAAICSAASRCPEASWIQGCRRECKRSKCQWDVTNSNCKLGWNLYCRHRLVPLLFYSTVTIGSGST